MANIVFPAYRYAAYTGGANVSLTGADLRCFFVDLADYTYSAAHDMLDDIAAGARIGTPQQILNHTFNSTTLVLDGDDVAFAGLTGDPSEYLCIYRHTGTESTSRLISLIDTATGLTLTPNGGTVNVTWHASGIITF